MREKLGYSTKEVISGFWGAVVGLCQTMTSAMQAARNMQVICEMMRNIKFREVPDQASESPQKGGQELNENKSL